MLLTVDCDSCIGGYFSVDSGVYCRIFQCYSGLSGCFSVIDKGGLSGCFSVCDKRGLTGCFSVCDKSGLWVFHCL